ncbi:Flagellar FliJ protein [Pirellulimonas nuda]|uniref:Flagellar FliJ protein n=1 Tax=Pirellulimonas nuda TaxID=2528009 RepID=A0A518D9S0_9BACT|nr:flagellar export protein FliJ [Pirellulimonas nuda]QDU88230.1 Flagellar FliJ protein [Pirellulimonas nuda]
MKPYRFRLETLLDLRKQRRDEMRARVAEAQRAVDVIDSQRAKLDSEAAQVRASARSLFDDGVFNVNRALEVSRYELLLKAQVDDLDRKAELLNDEVEVRRQAAVVADRDVRALELLDERRREEHRRAARRAEARAMDEAAGVAAARRMMREAT